MEGEDRELFSIEISEEEEDTYEYYEEPEEKAQNGNEESLNDSVRRSIIPPFHPMGKISSSRLIGFFFRCFKI